MMVGDEYMVIDEGKRVAKEPTDSVEGGSA